MKNLQYEIRITQKIYKRATIHYCAWYSFFRNRRYYIIVQWNGKDWFFRRKKKLTEKANFQLRVIIYY